MLVPGLACLGACASSGYDAGGDAGLTVYCAGAGNFDFGEIALRQGLRDAGYQGAVTPYAWSACPGPLGVLIDHLGRDHARRRAAELAQRVEQYVDRHPGRSVNLVGLSAGTAVVLWALESLRADYHVDNVVLLNSSVSSQFDVSRALSRVRGRVYCFHSPNDAVLALPLRLCGTADGVPGAHAAGEVGLATRDSRVVNIAWRPRFAALGNRGGHTDCLQPSFVRWEVADRLMAPTQNDFAGLALATFPWNVLPAPPPATDRP